MGHPVQCRSKAEGAWNNNMQATMGTAGNPK